MFRRPAQRWWTDITGPARLVEGIVGEFDRSRHVAVCSDRPFNWPEQLRRTVTERLRDLDGNWMVEQLDASWPFADGKENGTAIEDYLLNWYTVAEVRQAYDPLGTETKAQYLARCGVFRERCFWVRDPDDRELAAWLDFLRRCPPPKRQDGSVILELRPGQQRLLPASENRPQQLAVLRQENYIDYFDALLFNSAMCAELELGDGWKRYLAVAATELCQLDVRAALDLLERMTTHGEDPLSALGCGEAAARDPALKRRLWMAQLQVLFPLLEEERLRLIAAYEERIRGILGVPYWVASRDETWPLFRQYGQELTDPHEAELGTLASMTAVHRADDHEERLLYLPRPDWQQLLLLREMRNLLAHRQLCDHGQVRRFLDECPYFWANPDRPFIPAPETDELPEEADFAAGERADGFLDDDY
ncbi:MAG: hypothetical protein QM270_09895 [Bacillota bacterium]|nr:hypothetical protein [Bacillota bacterium]